MTPIGRTPGERTAHGYRLAIGPDVYETRAIATPIPNLSVYTLSVNGRLRKLFRGRFTTYSPDLGSGGPGRPCSLDLR